MNKQYLYMVGDFETTVYAGQKSTEVWASAVVPFFSEDVQIYHSIEETLDALISLNRNIIIYYHNLKFDGSFWLDYLMHNPKYSLAVHKTGDADLDIDYLTEKEMKNNSFTTLISDLGQWYNIKIKVNGKIIEMRDSLKLLPFSVKQIGNSFDTKHKKLEMEYTGFRYAGCEITEEEKQYIANDVLVVKEALENLLNEGHKKSTIGSCALDEFKRITGDYCYAEYFPDVYKIPLDFEKYGSENAGEYIRKSYKGGWCYVVKGKENKVFHDGITLDVNSLYPSVMSEMSGNYYPIGKPYFMRGKAMADYIQQMKNDKCEYYQEYYFVRIKTKFQLKEGYLPCIQIKSSFLYRANERLETSDIYDRRTNKYYDKYREFDGSIQEASVILTLTQTDFELIQEHYDLYDFEILDGCVFQSERALFDKYITKYKTIKQNSTGARRTLAKLMLNSLYGKLSTSPTASHKVPYLRDDGSISFIPVADSEKKTVYIPAGSAITSYARAFTIRAAQANYYGKDKRGFIYADTDSLHLDLKPSEIKGVEIDDKEFCKWKLESCWTDAIFVRQKTYIEHICDEYDIKCAGMPPNCKALLSLSLKQKTEQEYIDEIGKENWNTLSDYKKQFILSKKELTDFKIGLKIEGKLLPKRIAGGIVLSETTYELR